MKVDAQGSLEAMNGLSDSVQAFAVGAQGVNSEILQLYRSSSRSVLQK